MPVINSEALEYLRTMGDNSVDSVVTDPPYGLNFMGKKWDVSVPNSELWSEVFRVLKPGGHLVSFFGTRTYHRGAVAIEDGGFEIRDQLGWMYGSGFPKSHNISKALDAMNGKTGIQGPLKRGGERLARLEDGSRVGGGRWGDEVGRNPFMILPESEDAKLWDGWGTALKPAWEPIALARKPISESTVVANVLRWGTGALNVDGCRVEAEKAAGWGGGSRLFEGGLSRESGEPRLQDVGRWPANVLHDGSEEVIDVLGDAQRFFYCAKASKKDRDEGLEDFTVQKTNDGRKVDANNAYQRGATLRHNNHPTVKPTKLMRWLCRLITPPGGLILDPFSGSGSTGKGAVMDGFRFIGTEQDAECTVMANTRIEYATRCLLQSPTLESIFE